MWIREAAHRNLRIRDTQARMGAALSGVRLILFSANYVVQGQEVQRPEYNATGSNLDYETNLGWTRSEAQFVDVSSAFQHRLRLIGRSFGITG